MEAKEKKNLLLAWVLNIAPGLGLLYVGKTWIGVLFLILAGIFLLLCLTGIGAIIGLPFYLLTSLVACVLSVVYAQRHNKDVLLASQADGE